MQFIRYVNASVLNSIAYFSLGRQQKNKMMDAHMCPDIRSAVKCNHIECLRNLSISHAPNKREQRKLCEYASSVNRLNCLKFFHEYKYAWDHTVVDTCAFNGHLSCLKYAIKNNCQIGENSCNYAIQNGNVKCVEYLCRHNCPKDEYTFVVASVKGDIECVKILHKYGCGANKNALKNAVKYGHIECVKYMCINNFPMSKNIREYAAEFRQFDILTYLKSIDVKKNERPSNSLVAAREKIKDMQYAEQCGFTVPIFTKLYWAIHAGDLELIKKYMPEYTPTINGALYWNYIFESGHGNELEILEYISKNKYQSKISQPMSTYLSTYLGREKPCIIEYIWKNFTDRTVKFNDFIQQTINGIIAMPSTENMKQLIDLCNKYK